MTSLSDYSAFFGRSEPEVAAALESFCAFLQRWNRAQNLVSRETSPALWQRHILDSLQMLPFLGDDCHILLDLGSGGGFPAVPVAIALKGTAFSYTLVEANARKASFLRACAREFALPVTVLTARAESLSADRVPIPDVITSRAMAPLPLLLELSVPFFGPGTRALFHKGRGHGEEVSESSASWRFDMVKHQSDTDPDAVLLEISNLARRG